MVLSGCPQLTVNTDLWALTAASALLQIQLGLMQTLMPSVIYYESRGGRPEPDYGYRPCALLSVSRSASDFPSSTACLPSSASSPWSATYGLLNVTGTRWDYVGFSDTGPDPQGTSSRDPSGMDMRYWHIVSLGPYPPLPSPIFPGQNTTIPGQSNTTSVRKHPTFL